MHKFRYKTPNRREGRVICKEYKSYKKTLREDFNCRCGYCDDFDYIRTRNYAIDHFVPRTPSEIESFINSIPDNNYYNLVYSCSFCNLAKSNKWPTRDGSIHNDGNVGFIDPTIEEYSNLFKRNKQGKIECNNINTILSKHIIDELKLWYPIHSLNWRLEKIICLEKEIRGVLEKVDNEELKQIHYEILQIFSTLVNGIFKENE